MLIRIDQTIYTITIVTSSEKDSGTDSGVFMTIYGDKGQTKTFQLITTKQDSELLFKPGGANQFEFELDDVGIVSFNEIFRILSLFFLHRLIKLILDKMEKVFIQSGIQKQYKFKKDQKSTCIIKLNLNIIHHLF
jgi:hypothetical protein